MIKNRPKFTAEKTFDLTNFLIMSIVVVVTLYPFLNVLAISLNESLDTVKGGISIYPRKFTLDNYKIIFTYKNLLNAFIMSTLRTVVGAVTGLTACTMVAFTLSRKDFQARGPFSVFLALTLYVSGGLIPGFLLIRDLHLMNNFWVYILPSMVNAFYVFMIRTYMSGLPFELQESAFMDGANDLLIFFRIVLPLCTPVLATIALFIAVGQWNAWFDTYLYNGSSDILTTLQFELMKILQSTQAGADQARSNSTLQQMKSITPESIKMAITIVTVIPILMVYPFLQRYFIKGMTIGAVKS